MHATKKCNHFVTSLRTLDFISHFLSVRYAVCPFAWLYLSLPVCRSFFLCPSLCLCIGGQTYDLRDEADVPRKVYRGRKRTSRRRAGCSEEEESTAAAAGCKLQQYMRRRDYEYEYLYRVKMVSEYTSQHWRENQGNETRNI